jgi:formate hydrogenlyase subunit 6/NADH:ubiquinone oxidoreductase subunit I
MLRAFENGADGVFVGGCLKEQCHYVDGNEKAEARVDFLKKMLKAFGLGEERLTMQFMSAAMGSEFARVAQNVTDTVKELGPNPLKNMELTRLSSQNKRENLRNLLSSISIKLNKEPDELKEIIRGFGEPQIDDEKCIGCGACAYVCVNEAMNTDTWKDKVRLTHKYWKCTACGNCRDCCPKECMEVDDAFDLSRFLSDEKNVMVETGVLSCQRCGDNFLPLLLEEDVKKVLGEKQDTDTYLELCPACRRFAWAERIRSSHGFQGEWKKINAKGKSTS